MAYITYEDLCDQFTQKYIDETFKDSLFNEIERLKDIADFVIVHDTQPEDNKFYHFDHVFRKFKYRFDYKKASPNTTVLSNFHDLSFLNK
jgi:hypothetical protein